MKKCAQNSPLPGVRNRHPSPGILWSSKLEEHKEMHTKTHYNQNITVKYREIISKTAREKQLVTFKGTLIRLSTDFFKN